MHGVTHQERRQAPRAPFGEPVMIRTGLGVLPAKGGNVSESGMLLSTRAEEGSAQEPRLWLSFTLPRVPHVLQLRAEVVRKQRSGEQFHLGVRFVEMPRGVRRMLRTYVFTGGGRVKDYSPDEHQATVQGSSRSLPRQITP